MRLALFQTTVCIWHIKKYIQKLYFTSVKMTKLYLVHVEVFVTCQSSNKSHPRLLFCQCLLTWCVKTGNQFQSYYLSLKFRRCQILWKPYVRQSGFWSLFHTDLCHLVFRVELLVAGVGHRIVRVPVVRAEQSRWKTSWSLFLMFVMYLRSSCTNFNTSTHKYLYSL